MRRKQLDYGVVRPALNRWLADVDRQRTVGADFDEWALPAARFYPDDDGFSHEADTRASSVSSTSARSGGTATCITTPSPTPSNSNVKNEQHSLSRRARSRA